MRLRKPGSRASRALGAPVRANVPQNARNASVPWRRRPVAARRRRTVPARSASVAKRTSVELIALARELIRIPAALYMRIAERLGGVVLAVWLRIWPYFVRVWHLAGRAPRLGRARRHSGARHRRRRAADRRRARGFAVGGPQRDLDRRRCISGPRGCRRRARGDDEDGRAPRTPGSASRLRSSPLS